MRYVLDASAVLRYTDDEPGGTRVRKLLESALDTGDDLIISVVNWGEAIGVILKKYAAEGRRIAAELMALPFTLVDADRKQAEAAAILRQDCEIPYADAFAAVLAERLSATLVTGDFDFKNLPAGFVRVEYLPQK